MRARGGGDDDGLDCGRDLLGLGEDPDRALPRGFLGPPLVMVVDPDELDAGQGPRHADVVTPEVSDSDDRQPDPRRRAGTGLHHLMKPRSLVSMNRTSSSTSG